MPYTRLEKLFLHRQRLLINYFYFEINCNHEKFIGTVYVMDECIANFPLLKKYRNSRQSSRSSSRQLKERF